MLYDENYGIIPDQKSDILNDYLNKSLNTFTNAASPDSPAYVIQSICADLDFINQSALEVFNNCKNSNTARGMGLDMLANTVLNLFRKPLTTSSCVLIVTVGNLLSYLDVQVTVNYTGTPVTLAIGWSATGVISPTSPYVTKTSYTFTASGTYTVRVYSTDTTTDIPIGSINGGTSVAGVTGVANLSPANLGTVTIPADWGVQSTIISDSPIYTPLQQHVFRQNGTYNIIVYSKNITRFINTGDLNSAPSILNVDPSPANMILNVFNPRQNVLGSPAENDKEFSARRKYFLNVEGQTYYGLEKVIQNLNVPALRTVFVEEVVEDDYSPSIVSLQINVTVPGGGSVVIPVNTIAEGTVTPTAPYKTISEYVFTTSGIKYIVLFSDDKETYIPEGSFNILTPPVSGVVVNTNLSPAILKVTVGLGKRGYRVYLGYPTNGAGGTFDTQDLYLQIIASTCFKYHIFGTKFYGDVAGSTAFNVRSPYSGYNSTVNLSPLQDDLVIVRLTLVYNLRPIDAGFANGVFTANLDTIKLELLELINEYFLSKTLPTDLVYTISELTTLIQSRYTGIVSLGNADNPFVFETIVPPLANVVFIRRRIGYTFLLNEDNFHFTAVNKD